jgi:hypothetical protein
MTALKSQCYTYLGNAYNVTTLPLYDKGMMILALRHLCTFTGRKMG